MDRPNLDRLDSFQVDFFGTWQPHQRSPQLLTVSKKTGSYLWAFLTLQDALNVSVTSKTVAGLMVSRDILEAYLRQSPRTHMLGNFALTFSSDVTFGIMRRILHRVLCGSSGVLSIDVQSGRIIMDIGSAFNDHEVYSSHSAPLDDDDSTVTDVGIQKYLEIASYDEYDDFAPRHPMPREKTHRRGDSYFNSDVEYAANEALALMAEPLEPTSDTMDLAEIAAQAVAMELMAPPAPQHRKLPSTTSMSSQSLQKFAMDALADEK